MRLTAIGCTVYLHRLVGDDAPILFQHAALRRISKRCKLHRGTAFRLVGYGDVMLRQRGLGMPMPRDPGIAVAASDY